MPRTDDAKVKAILAPGLDYDLNRNPSLAPFIAAASLIVDDVVEAASADSVTLSDARLLELEGWLAAHAYKCSDKDFSSRSTNGANGTFAGQTGKGLDATLYGQMAQTLDTSGYLAEVIAGVVWADGTWLGQDPPDQSAYGE